ncbi:MULTISPECIES: hypothetical protein [Actinomadura]|uniref:hypothetical protein n=1 Tax=Actinomadura TaxID=1988 RepID=UPI0003AD3DF0|nr:hypothetical protein [Actinomadura madurae]SPT59648.1 Uncharacterised protein [Actinomadura madurae]
MTPWAMAEIDPERIAAGLARRFPGCCVWLGEYTGSWWAMTGDRLVEAPDPATLERLLDGLSRRAHARRYASFQNRTAGRGTPPPPRASRPAVPTGPPTRRPAVRARRIERRPRGGLLRRLFGSFVVVEGW